MTASQLSFLSAHDQNKNISRSCLVYGLIIPFCIIVSYLEQKAPKVEAEHSAMCHYLLRRFKYLMHLMLRNS